MERSINLSHHRRGNILVGCGVVLLVLGIVAGVGIYWVANSWRGWTATGIKEMSREMLKEMQVDPQEQAEAMVHIEDLMTRFEQGDVSLEQLGEVAEALAESPLVAAGIVALSDKQYIATSTLPDEEKAQARIDLDRFAQGIKNKDIDKEHIDDVLGPVTTTTPDDNDLRINISFSADGSKQETALRSPDEVSDEEVRELVSRAKTHADDAGISQTPTPVDLSDELGRAIAIALGETPELPEPSASEDTAQTPEPEQEP